MGYKGAFVLGKMDMDKRWVVLIVAVILMVTPLSAGASSVEDGSGSDDHVGGSDSSASGADDSPSPVSGDRNLSQDRLLNITDDHLSNQTRDQDSLENQTRDQNQLYNTTIDGSQDRLQNQTRLLNETELHDQIQERVRELDRDQVNLSTSNQEVVAQYTNASAFVYTLQNQSDQFDGLGPQISQYAMQINTSLQDEIQAQERIQNRNSIVRFFAGGDEVAAGDLQRQAASVQQQIQEMEQLIQQCSCDSEVKTLLQNELQQMQQQQTQLQQIAQKDLQDKGLIGWLWK
jgi:hypothetical protein